MSKEDAWKLELVREGIAEMLEVTRKRAVEIGGCPWIPAVALSILGKRIDGMLNLLAMEVPVVQEK
jgi:hypothetical protein